MTYAEVVAWLDSYANVEQRLDPAQWAGVKLERVVRLMELLGRPQLHGRTVHIAGSKGKGSVAAMVDSVLRAAGWRVGLYTSPHLVSRRERIRLDGRPIDEATVARLATDRLRPAAEAYERDPADGPLTFFDLHTALAFLAFQEAGVDWSVVEVGLGGRLDATNVVAPELTAITTLGLEHTRLLGATVDLIAGEKAGIIKPGVPVVVAPQPPEAWAVVEARARDGQAPLLRAHGVAAVPGAEFLDEGGQPYQRVQVDWSNGGGEVKLPLLGAHQVVNASVARTLLVPIAHAEPRLDWRALTEGLEHVRWPGRLEVVDRHPWVILDGAHTPQAGYWLAEALDLFPHQRRWLVLGSAADKDYAGLAAQLCPDAAGVVVTGVPGNPRAAAPERLLPAVTPHCARVELRAEPAAALDLARSWAGPDDLVCVTGSLYLVGALLAELRGTEPAT